MDSCSTLLAVASPHGLPFLSSPHVTRARVRRNAPWIVPHPRILSTVQTWQFRNTRDYFLSIRKKIDSYLILQVNSRGNCTLEFYLRPREILLSPFVIPGITNGLVHPPMVGEIL